MSVFVPLPGDVLQRHLAHEDGVLVLLDVEVLQILHDLQLVFCESQQTKYTQKSLFHSFTRAYFNNI